VLKRDPQNVDAMTHLGLIVALGGHVDQALQTLDRALAIDPNYPPALLYRGQILLESKKDAPGAIKSSRGRNSWPSRRRARNGIGLPSYSIRRGRAAKERTPGRPRSSPRPESPGQPSARHRKR
jgi:hypothetical protein